jgi:hypothetical protein
MMDRVLDVMIFNLHHFLTLDATIFFLQEETENGNPQEDGKKMYEQEEYSGTDSDEDEVQYGARRRKPDKGPFRGNKY